MKFCLIIITLFLLGHILLACPIQTQPSREKTEEQGTLKLGENQQRTLAPGTIHVWNLGLKKGQYIGVEVQQKKMAVIVRSIGPAGTQTGEVAIPIEKSRAEKIIWITQKAGIWKMEIAPSEAGHAGSYEIKWMTQHEATERDKQTFAADSLSAIAQDNYAQGKFTEAESLYKRALELREKALGAEHLDVATDLNNLGAMYIARGKFAEAEPLLKRSLAIREKALKPNHPDLASSLNNLAELYRNQNRNAEAEPLYKRALAIIEKAFEPEHNERARTLNNLAILYYNQAKYAEAESLFQSSIAIKEKLVGPNHVDVARSINNLASVHRDQGQYAKAEQEYARALSIREKALGPEHPQVAISLNNLASFYDTQGRFAEAEPLFKRSLAIEEKALGPEHPNVATDLSNLAGLYENQGKYAEAESLYKRSVFISKKTLGPNHPKIAFAYSNLANLYFDQSRYAEAEALHKQSLAIREKAFGAEHPEIARGFSNLAELYWAQGRYAEAEPLFKNALAIRERKMGPTHTLLAQSFVELANLYVDQHRYARAESLYFLSLEIREKAWGRDHMSVATDLNNLATMYRDQGKYATAEPFIRRALEIRKKVFGPDHPSVAISLCNLSKTLFWTEPENADTALALIGQAIRILDNTPSFPRWKVDAYALRASIQKQKGDLGGALSNLAVVLQLAEVLRPQLGGDEETQAGFFERWYVNLFNRMVSWQIEAGQIEKALEYAERGRARVLLDQFVTSQIDLRSSIPADIRTPLEKRETDAKARLAEYQQRMTLMRSRKDLSDDERTRQSAALQDSFRLADRDYQQVYEEIKNASPLWRDLITSGGQPVALATIQRELIPSNGLMLLYQIGKEESHLFIIAPADQKPEVLPLHVTDKVASVLGIKVGPLKSTDLQKIVVGSNDFSKSGMGLLQYLSGSTRSITASQTKTFSDKLQALWQVLVPAPLWPRLKKCSEVVIIPDGALHLLSFEALVVQSGSAPSKVRYWLDEGPAIRYSPSATSLYNIEKRPAVSMTPSTVLSLSDPIFSSTKVEQELASTRGSPLPSTRPLLRLQWTASETKEIGKAFGKDRILELMRLDANEAKLRAGLPGKTYIHLATHGVVDQERNSSFAALALTPLPSDTVLAENDGFLRLYEIYDLKLPECEMVALSACETNGGRYFEGEGVFALSRGFLAAGARRVIATHWSVNDKSSAKLIGAFFNQIATTEKSGQKIDFAKALHEAKRKVRQHGWADPYYWAPFILMGKR